MPDRNSLLGRSRPNEKLSKEEIAALDKVTSTPPRPQPASTSAKPVDGKKLRVPAKALNFHWTTLSVLLAAVRLQGRASPSPVSASLGAGAAEPRFTWIRREKGC